MPESRCFQTGASHKAARPAQHHRTGNSYTSCCQRDAEAILTLLAVTRLEALYELVPAATAEETCATASHIRSLDIEPERAMHDLTVRLLEA